MAHTHELTFTGAVLTKRYTSWSRGEHNREWTVLRLAHRHRPGLVPEPLTADLRADPPTVTMSRLPGRPLCAEPAPAQLAALAEAIQALWTVPRAADKWSAPPAGDWSVLPAGDWEDDLRFARRLTSGHRPAAGIAAEAYDAAQAWWDGPDPDLLRTRPTELVLGHRDPNLANYLWDGTQIRIVDFEDAALSDPATELAILAEHLSARHLDFDRLITHFPVIDERRFDAARRVFAMLWLRLLLTRHTAELRPAESDSTSATRGLINPAPATPSPEPFNSGPPLPGPPAIVEEQAARLLRLLA